MSSPQRFSLASADASTCLFRVLCIQMIVLLDNSIMANALQQLEDAAGCGLILHYFHGHITNTTLESLIFGLNSGDPLQ